MPRPDATDPSVSGSGPEQHRARYKPKTAKNTNTMMKKKKQKEDNECAMTHDRSSSLLVA